MTTHVATPATLAKIAREAKPGDTIILKLGPGQEKVWTVEEEKA